MNTLQAFKENLEAHMDELKERAPERKKEINRQYEQVSLVYEQALNASLAPNGEIIALTAELDKVHQDVQRAMDQNEDIAGIIDKISTGVGILTKIAGMVIKT